MNKKAKIIGCLIIITIFIAFYFFASKNTEHNQEEQSQENNQCIFYINDTKLTNQNNYIIGNINEPPTISIKNCKEKINTITLDGEKIDIENKNQALSKLPFLILPQQHKIIINNEAFNFNYLLKDDFSFPLIDGINQNWVIPEGTNRDSWDIKNNTLYFKNNDQTGHPSLASQYRISENFIIEFTLKLNSENAKPIIYLLSNGDTFFFYNYELGIKSGKKQDEYIPFNFKVNQHYRVKIIRNKNIYKIFGEKINEEIKNLYNFKSSEIFTYNRNKEIYENDYWGIGSWSNNEFEINNLIFGEY
ncbi:hypothetical protein M0Q39_04895 [Patescibacteria group bacterium]|nr:hypothetical protein [Patescibacteria group bacterium]MDD3940105.1 hypothetical protein [Candidatus Paceibacterota bacterium]